jgi:predicted nucleic acid-binding Zn ribbon protein
MERIGGEIRSELSRFGPQAGMAELLERWPQAVGAQIARFAWPARIGRDGTVHVHTADSVWAFELGRRSAEIAGRLGVEKLRFAPGPLPSPEAAEPAREAVRPRPEDEARAAEIAAAITDENLRETVQKAVAFSLATGAAGR